jgi:pyruvate formate lyase activating enzyme
MALDTKGRIFDIQKFSVHDGPGIRTIVFLKGCVLRCKWCCNPESQEYDIQQMTLNGKTKTVGRDVTVKEVLDEVEKDRIYFRRSGGGLTLSGGESMCQPDFAVALLEEAHERGINTAIETTACVKWETVARFLPHLDTVLMDIKHMDSEKHYSFTNQHNELILENAKKIAHSGVDMVVRVPVIPTFNDTVEEISSIARFAVSIGVKKMHLLPYHRFGIDKYKGLNRDYLLPDITTPDDSKMQQLLDAAKATGIYAQIGG